MFPNCRLKEIGVWEPPRINRFGSLETAIA